jgi:PTS system cellobiose-specific IIB component
MKKIILFCANGFTTIMMREKIKEAAAKEGLEYTVEAYPYSECMKQGINADVILLAPQIRYNRKTVEKQFPDKKLVVLDMTQYGAMDGVAILKAVKEILGD